MITPHVYDLMKTLYHFQYFPLSLYQYHLQVFASKVFFIRNLFIDALHLNAFLPFQILYISETVIHFMPLSSSFYPSNTFFT